MGNFLGDFVKGAAARTLPVGIQRGIEMHRAIDHLTDTDPDVRALNRSVAKRHGRYAGVVTDIGFDYFLFQHWTDFGPASFDFFCEQTYENLQAYRPLMSKKVQQYVTGMTRDNWLRLYTSPVGMETVFDRLRPRLSRPEALDGIEHLLPDFHPAFNQTFLRLFPRLQQLANAFQTDSPPTD